MKLLSLLLVPLLWTPSSPARAQDPATAASTPDERLQLVGELCLAHDKALEAFWESWRAIEGDEARSSYRAEHFPAVDTTAAILLALVEEHPGEEAGFRALSWLTRLQLQTPTTTSARVHALLAAHYLDHEGLADVVSDLAYEFAQSAGDLLQAASERSTQHATRGRACYAYAKHLLRRASFASRLRGLDEAELADYRESYGEETVDAMRQVDVAACQARAEALLERVASDFGDLPAWSGTLADAARGDLFELRELAIGKVAPEIEGEDVFGEPFALSDYRGKVVVLDFWGHW